MDTFTIKDLENLSGIRAHTLRIWEQRYNFLKPGRTSTRIRNYTGDELKLILKVSLLNKNGFKISNINKMDEKEIGDKILSLTSTEAQQERLINELLQYMLDLNMEGMESLLDAYILSRGIEKTILEIIFPFLERIGMLWFTNNMRPAQEHLVSNLIRQKLIMGIESLSPIAKINKTILLFLPENEYHEIGLLFMHFLLKNRGIKVIYLGCDVPVEEVKYVADIKKPDYLYCHLTSGSGLKTEKFLSKMEHHLSHFPLVISGRAATGFAAKAKNPVKLIRTIEDGMEFARTIQ